MGEPAEIRLSSGFMHWYEPTTAGPTPVGIHLIGETPVAEIHTANGPMYRTSDRVVGDGFVVAGAKQLIPMETAREWAAKGWLNDPSLLRSDGKMIDPREEIKAEAPVKAPVKSKAAKKG